MVDFLVGADEAPVLYVSKEHGVRIVTIHVAGKWPCFSLPTVAGAGTLTTSCPRPVLITERVRVAELWSEVGGHLPALG